MLTTPLTHAMILAAGLGTRMRPLTDTLPKPLIPFAGMPLIDHCLAWLQEGGIAQVVVNSSYRAEQLEAHLAARTAAGKGPNVQISREEFPPLETGGGVRKALPWLGKTPFVTMNSDAVFVPSSAQAIHPLHAMQEAWEDALDMVMLLVPLSQAVGWSGAGDFLMDEAGRVRRPKEGEQATHLFSGVQMLHPRVFADAPEGAFSLGYFWKIRTGTDGWFDRVRAIPFAGKWLNLGDLEGLCASEACLHTNNATL